MHQDLNHCVCLDRAVGTRTVSSVAFRCSTVSEARDAFFFYARPISCRLGGIIDLTAKVMLCDATGN